MILDTSAVSAIFFNEPEGDHFLQMIRDADRCRISAANFVELSIAPFIAPAIFEPGPAMIPR